MTDQNDRIERWLRVTLGLACLSVGSVVLGFIIWALWPLASSGDPVVLKAISSALPLERTPQALQTPQGSVILPGGFAATTSLVLTILILGIVVSIGKGFLSVGVSLLNPDMRKILSRLKDTYGKH